MPQFSATITYVSPQMSKSFNHLLNWQDKKGQRMPVITAVCTVHALSGTPTLQLKAFRASSQGSASGSGLPEGSLYRVND